MTLTPKWIMLWTFAAAGLAAHFAAGGTRRPYFLAAPLAANAAVAVILPFAAFRFQTAWYASFGILGGVAVAVSTADHGRDPSKLRKIGIAVVVSGLVAAVYGFMQYFGLDLYRWSLSYGGQRPFSTFGNPNHLGGHFAVLVPWAVALFLAATASKAGGRPALLVAVGRYSVAGWMALAASWLLLVLVAQTRGAWIACAVALAWLGWRWGKRDRGLFAGGTGRVAVLAAVACVVGSGMAARNRDLALRVLDTVPREAGQLTKRFVAMRAALFITRDRPLAGIGPGCFKHGFGMHMARAMRPAERAQFVNTYSEGWTHCDPLQILAETGIIGLGIFAWLAVAAVRALLVARNGRRVPALAVLAGGIALLVHGSANFPMHVAPTAFLFWLGTGIAAVLADSGGGGAPVDPGKRPGGFLKYGAVVLLASGAVMTGTLGGMIMASSIYDRLGKDCLDRQAWTPALGALDKGLRADWDDRREAFYAGAVWFHLGKYDAAVESC